jgi:hypothetical protein
MKKIIFGLGLLLAVAVPALAATQTTTVITTTVATYEVTPVEVTTVQPVTTQPVAPQPVTAAAPVTPSTAPVKDSGRSLFMDAGIGLGYNYLYPKDVQIESYYKGGLMWKAFLEFKADNGISVGGDFGIFSQENMSPVPPAGTALTIIPITGSIAYHLFRDSAISPYLGGGVGIYFINENDPDYSYLNTTKFGKHIFVGTDIYFNPESLLRFELRQTFIDEVSSSSYYKANFGGISAIASLAIEIPLMGKEADMSSDERALYRKETRYERSYQSRLRRLEEMQALERQERWDPWVYDRYHNRQYLQQQIIIVKGELESDRYEAERARHEREKKRQQYLDEKNRLRDEKKKQNNSENSDEKRQQYLQDKQNLMNH